jgi:hypothetical protein
MADARGARLTCPSYQSQSRKYWTDSLRNATLSAMVRVLASVRYSFAKHCADSYSRGGLRNSLLVARSSCLRSQAELNDRRPGNLSEQDVPDQTAPSRHRQLRRRFASAED